MKIHFTAYISPRQPCLFTSAETVAETMAAALAVRKHDTVTIRVKRVKKRGNPADGCLRLLMTETRQAQPNTSAHVHL